MINKVNIGGILIVGTDLEKICFCFEIIKKSAQKYAMGKNRNRKNINCML